LSVQGKSFTAFYIVRKYRATNRRLAYILVSAQAPRPNCLRVNHMVPPPT